MFAPRVLQAARSPILINKRCFSAAITSRQKLVDLSRELYHRSPGHPFHPPMVMAQWDTHQEMKAGNTIFRTASYFVSFSDHAGTHVDAPKHFSAEPGAKSIDEMPLDSFYTDAICLDLSHVELGAAISVNEMKASSISKHIMHVPREVLHTLRAWITSSQSLARVALSSLAFL